MLKEKFDIRGKRGIVTGGSKGLGKGMAAGLAEMGADIVIAARNSGELEQTAEELREFGGKVVPVRADMADESDIKKLVEIACVELGGLDFAVLNAGIVKRAVSHEHSVQDFDDVMRVNIRGVFLCAREAARVMINRDNGGSIIITDSVVSVHGSRNIPGYTASKGAVHSMIHTLANDWGPYGIRVNGIGPGFCETDMTENLRNQPERNDYLTSRMALGRWGKPEDFAGAAVFLVSEASSYITGTTLFIDGGFLGM